MTEERAREILQEYRETDEETGQTYGLTVKRCLSAEGAQFVFLCALEGGCRCGARIAPRKTESFMKAPS